MIISKLTNYVLLNIQRALGIKNITGYPYYVIIDPSNICQLKCTFCDGRARPQAMMKFQEFKKIIDIVGKTCINLELYNWGEPFLNKDIIRMINYASQTYGVYTRISSNLNVRNDEFYRELVLSRLNSLTISLDGASPETYATYRVNGSFDRVINNIKLIAEYKKHYDKTEPKLMWQFLVFRHNEHEIEKAKRMAEELSVNEIIFVKPHIPNENKNWDSSIKEFANFSDNARHKKEKKKCNWPYTSIAINSNMSVSPCCGVAREEDDFGNIRNGNLAEIWNNGNFSSAREYVSRDLTKKDSGNVCARCEMKGSINYSPGFFQVLYYLITPLRMAYMNLNKFKVSSY
jgi:radical SAM protein with 4Fe4S-binding SPASM domain